MIKNNNVKVLDVYLSKKYIGKLTRQNSKLSFIYDSGYLDSKDAIKLSMSLPLAHGAFDDSVTRPFFAGLLPDGWPCYRLAQGLGCFKQNIFELVKNVAGDCAGAVSLYPEGTAPGLDYRPTYYILGLLDADNILSSLRQNTPFLCGTRNVRMTCAGAQEKLTISFVNGRIAIPTRDTASTHIIKPVVSTFMDSVQNEFFCMRLAQKVGLDVPKVDILWIKNRAYYLIERYDRKVIDIVSSSNSSSMKQKVLKLHQEDFCQALGVLPDFKYENEGGPSIEECFKLLDDRIAAGFMEKQSRISLFKYIIFNFIIGNSDAHAKNFAILYKEGKEFLAPFYDLLSTVVYSNPLKSRMAMQINHKYSFRDISMRDFNSLGRKLGFREDLIESCVKVLSNSMLEGAQELIMELNSDIRTSSSIYERIYTVISENHDRLNGDDV